MSRNYWIGSQLFLHDKSSEKQSFENIKECILKAKEHMGLDCLIIYPAGIRKAEKIISFCSDNQVDSYLWYPILADSWNFESKEDELLLQHNGKRGKGTIGAWTPPAGSGEEFQFVCPNNPKAINRILSSYEYLLDNLDFKGVMLDRIRYPSCASGFESLFTCFCEHCKDKFEKQFGYSHNTVIEKTGRFFAKLQEKEILDGWGELDELINRIALKDHITFKKQNILEVVRTFSQLAKERTLSVGLDLYSPSLSPTVYQDYTLLAECCDWIKPMLYCHVQGPAGLPLEIAALWQALKTVNPGLSEIEIITFFERSLNQSLPDTKEQLLSRGVPEEIIQVEMRKIMEANMAEHVKIYPGIEAVSIPELGVEISPEIVDTYLHSITGTASEGIIASWNLIHIPEENMRSIGKFIKKADRLEKKSRPVIYKKL